MFARAEVKHTIYVERPHGNLQVIHNIGIKMKQLDVDVSPPTLEWNPNLTLTIYTTIGNHNFHRLYYTITLLSSVNFGQVMYRRTDRKRCI